MYIQFLSASFIEEIVCSPMYILDTFVKISLLYLRELISWFSVLF
jgi:hypothetical protein